MDQNNFELILFNFVIGLFHGMKCFPPLLSLSAFNNSWAIWPWPGLFIAVKAVYSLLVCWIFLFCSIMVFYHLGHNDFFSLHIKIKYSAHFTICLVSEFICDIFLLQFDIHVVVCYLLFLGLVMLFNYILYSSGYFFLFLFHSLFFSQFIIFHVPFVIYFVLQYVLVSNNSPIFIKISFGFFLL